MGEGGGGTTTDQDLGWVLRARSSGDPEAFEAPVAPRRAVLLRLLSAVIGDWQEAEDALREWNTLPLALGKECLLALDGETQPLYTPPHLRWEAVDAFEALADGSANLAAAMASLRAHIAERTATGRRGSLLKKDQ